MPRLFTGIAIPDKIASTLSRLQIGLDGARWINPSDYHITLRFIGDIDDQVANDVVDLLATVNKPQFEIKIQDFDAFGGNKPRSVFAKVELNDTLVELQQEHERLMQRIGLKAITRKYTPHITICRLRGFRAEAIALWLAQNSGFLSSTFQVEEFILYSAKSSTGGGPYVPEQIFPLREY